MKTTIGMILTAGMLLLSGCNGDDGNGETLYTNVPDEYKVITIPLVREADLNGTYPDPEEENLAFTVPVASKEDFQ